MKYATVLSLAVASLVVAGPIKEPLAERQQLELPPGLGRTVAVPPATGAPTPSGKTGQGMGKASQLSGGISAASTAIPKKGRAAVFSTTVRYMLTPNNTGKSQGAIPRAVLAWSTALQGVGDKAAKASRASGKGKAAKASGKGKGKASQASSVVPRPAATPPPAAAAHQDPLPTQPLVTGAPAHANYEDEDDGNDEQDD